MSRSRVVQQLLDEMLVSRRSPSTFLSNFSYLLPATIYTPRKREVLPKFSVLSKQKYKVPGQCSQSNALTISYTTGSLSTRMEYYKVHYPVTVNVHVLITKHFSFHCIPMKILIHMHDPEFHVPLQHPLQNQLS